MCSEGVRNLGIGGIADLLSLSVGFWGLRPAVVVFMQVSTTCGKCQRGVNRAEMSVSGGRKGGNKCGASGKLTIMVCSRRGYTATILCADTK